MTTYYPLPRVADDANLPSNHEQTQETAPSPPLTLPKTRTQFFLCLFGKTAGFTVGGTSFMVLGIYLGSVFLRRVYICPGGAACPHSFQPTNHVIQSIRTVMQYWLQIGMLLFGVGLAKLGGYQAWSTMRRRGTTIDVLDINLTTLHGSSFNAAKLLLLKGQNRSLAVFMLALIGITASISFVVGLSFSGLQDTGSTATVLFTYPATISLSGDYTQCSSFVQEWIKRELILGGGPSGPLAGGAFRGTMIVRDSRTTYAVNAMPKGYRISGTLSCIDPSANLSFTPPSSSSSPTTGVYGSGGLGSSGPNGTSSYSIVYTSTSSQLTVSALPSDPLLVALVGPLSGVENTLLWVSNTTGVIPNATQTSDGKLYIGVCTHSLSMFMISTPSGQGIQYILPSDVCSGCDDITVETHMSTALQGLFLSWLGFEMTSNGTTSRLQALPVACDTGIWSRTGTTGQGCSINNETWDATLDILLQGWLQTSPRTVNSTQELAVRKESISGQQWWVQGVIPLCALLLYVVCLVYTLSVHRAEEATFKELNALELVSAAAQVENLQILESTGRLTGSLNIGGNGFRNRGIKGGPNA